MCPADSTTTTLARLRALCPALARRVGEHIELGWGLDTPTLQVGCVHEWFGVGDSTGSDPRLQSTFSLQLKRRAVQKREWVPALSVVTHVVMHAAESADGSRLPSVVWIGRAAWTCPAFLRAVSAAQDRKQDGRGTRGAWGARGAREVSSQSIFVDVRSPAERLWAIDLALRSRRGVVVVADGSDFDMSATRRLQLASESGGGLCLLVRPPWERCVLSAASTRWAVNRVVSPVGVNTRRWSVELLRCKGMQPSTLANLRPWIVEVDDATRGVRVVSDVGGGLIEATSDSARASEGVATDRERIGDSIERRLTA